MQKYYTQGFHPSFMSTYFRPQKISKDAVLRLRPIHPAGNWIHPTDLREPSVKSLSSTPAAPAAPAAPAECWRPIELRARWFGLLLHGEGTPPGNAKVFTWISLRKMSNVRLISSQTRRTKAPVFFGFLTILIGKLPVSHSQPLPATHSHSPFLMQIMGYPIIPLSIIGDTMDIYIYIYHSISFN